MADPIIGAIDRFFDAVDGGVGAVDRVLHRVQHTEDKARSYRAKRTPEVIDVEAVPSPTPTPRHAPAPANARKLTQGSPQFHIVETIAPDTGITTYVVTNGSNSRAECTTRVLAEKLLRALETSP